LPNAAGTGSTVLGTWLEPSLANGNLVQHCIGTATSANNCATWTYNKNATLANSTSCLGLAGSGSTLCVDGNAKVYIGATGTGISASFRGTTSWTPGSIGAGGCASTSITLTGSAAGADCNVT